MRLVRVASFVCAWGPMLGVLWLWLVLWWLSRIVGPQTVTHSSLHMLGHRCLLGHGVGAYCIVCVCGPHSWSAGVP